MPCDRLIATASQFRIGRITSPAHSRHEKNRLHRGSSVGKNDERDRLRQLAAITQQEFLLHFSSFVSNRLRRSIHRVDHQKDFNRRIAVEAAA